MQIWTQIMVNGMVHLPLKSNLTTSSAFILHCMSADTYLHLYTEGRDYKAVPAH